MLRFFVAPFRNFHTRLFISYSLIIIVLAIAIGIPMYYYLKNNLEQNLDTSLEQIVNSSTDNFNLLETEFDNYTKQLYLNHVYTVDGDTTTDTVVKQLQTLQTKEADLPRAIQAVKATIGMGIEIYKNVERINIISVDGTQFSNKTTDTNIKNQPLADWAESVKQAEGFMLARHYDSDPWLTHSTTPIFSLARLLQSEGRPAGILELQILASDVINLQKIAKIPYDQIIVFNNENLIYAYPSHNQAQMNEAMKMLKANTDASVQRNESDNKIQLLQKSATGHFAIYMTVPQNKLYAPIRKFQLVMVLTVTVIVLFSILVYYFLAKILTNPIRRVRAVIDSLDLDNQGQNPQFNLNNDFYMDEIELLNRSFRKMNTRLQHSLSEIVDFNKLQLQSQFDLLQSQMNPHFLFNMLGVIHLLSQNNENQLASEVCIKLSEFLKYSMNTKETKVTLAAEIDFARMYLELMKTRYEHRLSFEIRIPQSLSHFEMPKLTIQPLIENCIQHGFKRIQHPLLIEIIGEVVGNSFKLTIRDNGCGFEPSIMADILSKLEQYQTNLTLLQKSDALTFGGMGIASTFLRLKLMFGDQLDFAIGNNQDQGAFIEIKGILPERIGVQA